MSGAGTVTVANAAYQKMPSHEKGRDGPLCGKQRTCYCNNLMRPTLGYSFPNKMSKDLFSGIREVTIFRDGEQGLKSIRARGYNRLLFQKTASTNGEDACIAPSAYSDLQSIGTTDTSKISYDLSV